MEKLPKIDSCLFCGCRGDYSVKQKIEFVCPVCVCILADAGQQDLKRAYKKAMRLNLPRKAMAISKFINGDIEDEQARKIRPNLVRTRPLPAVRPPRYEIRA